MKDEATGLTWEHNDCGVGMDRNKDGKLSRNEVRGALQRDFDRFDRNSDNYLTKEELLQRPR